MLAAPERRSLMNHSTSNSGAYGNYVTVDRAVSAAVDIVICRAAYSAFALALASGPETLGIGTAIGVGVGMAICIVGALGTVMTPNDDMNAAVHSVSSLLIPSGKMAFGITILATGDARLAIGAGNLGAATSGITGSRARPGLLTDEQLAEWMSMYEALRELEERITELQKQEQAQPLPPQSVVPPLRREGGFGIDKPRTSTDNRNWNDPTPSDFDKPGRTLTA